jgi:hypothetical protein
METKQDTLFPSLDELLSEGRAVAVVAPPGADSVDVDGGEDDAHGVYVEYEEVKDEPGQVPEEKSSSQAPALSKDIRHVYDGLFEHLNKTYNLDVRFDPESPMKSMQSLIDSTSSAAMSVYVNEGMKKSVLLLIPTIMSAIMELSKTTLTPDTFAELSYENKIITMEKLVGWIERLNAISEQANKNHGTEVLRNLRQEEDTTSMMDNPKVMDFLRQYAQDMREKGQQ